MSVQFVGLFWLDGWGKKDYIIANFIKVSMCFPVVQVLLTFLLGAQGLSNLLEGLLQSLDQVVYVVILGKWLVLDRIVCIDW